MFLDITLDILENIYDHCIHPNNKSYYLLILVNKYTNTNIKKYKRRMLCYYCKIILNKDKLIRGNGDYSTFENNPLCKKHIIKCTKCKDICDLFTFDLASRICYKCYYGIIFNDKED